MALSCLQVGVSGACPSARPSQHEVSGWASASSSALLAPFLPRVAPDAPVNAALSLPSFWSEPAALQDQLGRELQSRSDAASRLSLRRPSSAPTAGAVLLTPVPVEALDWGRKLLSDAGLGLFVVFSLLRVCG